MKKKMVALVLTALLLGGCAGNLSHSTDLTATVSGAVIEKVDISSESYQPQNPKQKIAGWNLELLRESFSGENILLSPLSLTAALGMAANGADGGTLTELETFLQTDVDTLNQYMKAYLDQLPGGQVKLADAIWLRSDDSLQVEEDFLRTAKDGYRAQVYQSAFDKGTQQDINAWVNQKTDGMIPRLLDSPPDSGAMVYLVNALSFDGEWAEKYKAERVHEDTFTTEEGEEQRVEFLFSDEGTYLAGEHTTGFMKSYKGGDYAFVALLPEEGMSMAEWLRGIDGEQLYELLENRQETSVGTAMPKFSVAYSAELQDILSGMGLGQAFDPMTADLSRMGSSQAGNLYISKVIHKTRIEVDEERTKAAAATVVEDGAAAAEAEVDNERLYLRLDRPFFYLILDTRQQFPLFMGVLMAVR